jgi:hypothetical protein
LVLEDIHIIKGATLGAIVAACTIRDKTGSSDDKYLFTGNEKMEKRKT